MSSVSVLLIDDEEEFVTTLQERLELRGLEVRVALDGHAGLNLLADKLPTLVVLDLRMPGLNGIEVLKQIRQQWPQLPVIMLSGHGSEQDAQTCLALGAVKYHKKPLDIDVLLADLQTIVTGQGR